MNDKRHLTHSTFNQFLDCETSLIVNRMNILTNRCNHGRHFHCDLLVFHIKILHKRETWLRLKTWRRRRIIYDLWQCVRRYHFMLRLQTMLTQQFFISRYCHFPKRSSLSQHYVSIMWALILLASLNVSLLQMHKRGICRGSLELFLFQLVCKKDGLWLSVWQKTAGFF